MKLKDLLEIKPGTLVKGLTISISGTASLSLEGWNIEAQKKSIKDSSLHVPTDYTFTYYKDERVAELIKKGKIHIFQPGNTKWSVLRCNGETYYKDIKYFFEKEALQTGECVGMSLGKSFIAIQPSHVDMYRPDFYEIYAFHNILQGEKSKWIVLQSKTQYKGLLVIDPDQVLLDIHMDLL